MQTFRANLTRLRSLIDSSVPDGPDVFDYQGVSKEVLFDALDVMAALSSQIGDYDEKFTFEIVAFKRFASATYQTLKKILEAEDELKKKQFDRFLTQFASLAEKLKVVLYVVKGEGFRSEVEIAAIKEDLNVLEGVAQQYNSLKTDLDFTLERGVKAAKILEEERDQSEGTAATLSKIVMEANEKRAEVSSIHDSVSEWEEEILEKKTSYGSLANSADSLLNSLKQEKAKISGITDASQELIESARAQAKKSDELQHEIERILGDANRVGMAASFRQRKNDLKHGHIVWQCFFLLSLIGVILVSSYFLLPELAKDSVSWASVFSKLWVTFPLVWIAWFSSKQYSQISRVREDYAFKEATAMAFEGHRKVARETDPELESELLSSCIENMELNPIRLLGSGSEHGSPAHEALDGILRSGKRLKNLSLRGPGQTELNADLETD